MTYKIHLYLPSKGMFYIENYENLNITFTDNYNQEYEYEAELLTSHQVFDWCDTCLRNIRFDNYMTYLMPKLYKLFSKSYEVFKVDFSRLFEHICDPEDDLNGCFLEIIKIEAPGNIF